jgi:hypothetical protein
LPSDPSVPADRTHLRTRMMRVAIGVIIAVALVLPVAAVPAAEPAAAGGSCTGWNSITRPPRTIRVLRSSGQVEVVDFKRYVTVVTAKEWPSYIPQAAIETGAAAVKQYGWYKTLAGNHRASFVTASGKCYDVVDSTRDQLYKPHLANVTDKVRRAVDSIWGLSLRKDGRFFETGYRTGTTNRCGRDANGRLLYAKSVIDCARRGMSRQDIQFRYYGKTLTLHWTDGRVISYRGQEAGGSAPAKAPAASPKPTPKPQAQQAPKPAPKPEAKASSTPAPQPSRRPRAASNAARDTEREAARPSSVQLSWGARTVALALPELVLADGGLDAAGALVAPPAAPVAEGATPGAAELSIPTLYSLPGTSLAPPRARGTDAVVARVYVDADRAWVIY